MNQVASTKGRSGQGWGPVYFNWLDLSDLGLLLGQGLELFNRREKTVSLEGWNVSLSQGGAQVWPLLSPSTPLSHVEPRSSGWGLYL